MRSGSIYGAARFKLIVVPLSPNNDPVGAPKRAISWLLAQRLKRLPDVTAAAINHPQSHLADFYREHGDVFGVALRPGNRWGGFKALRERWLSHMESTRCRSVLLVDEAQEMTPQVLSELRLLASSRFDSQPLLCRNSTLTSLHQHQSRHSVV